MHLLAGLHLAGATLTPLDDLAPGTARLGLAVLTPKRLLRDLELRLGLPGGDGSASLRLARWAARVGDIAPAGRFYSRSHSIDPLGTAAVLLHLRDELVEAGWNGQPIKVGGERIEAITELEALASPTLPRGVGDRLAAVALALKTATGALYDELELADAVPLWPARWGRVFARLAELGTRVHAISLRLGGAPSMTDLGRVQATLRGESGAGALRGDGSFVMLRAETSIEAANAIAALLRKWGTSDMVLLRAGEEATLESALTAQGIAAQGAASSSRWRPVLQVLPLALELAFAPKDPRRVLELLTLPVGPFQGIAGRELAGGLAEMPGIGGKAWCEAKEAAREGVWKSTTRRLVEKGNDEETARTLAHEVANARLKRVEEWFEQPGADPTVGATRSALGEVVARAIKWLAGRHANAPDDPVLGAALGQAAAVAEALAHDQRATLGLVQARQLVDAVTARGQTLPHSVERAGRPDYVAGPDGLMRERATVVWWHFVAGTERGPGLQLWRPAEVRALDEAGLRFPHPRALLAAEAESWRRTVLAARRRLVLVVPSRAVGAALTPHPFWDEIVARTDAETVDIARVTVHARDLLRAMPGVFGADGVLATTKLEPLALPEGLPVWTLNNSSIAPRESASASSLEAVLGCPLQWVLRYAAGITARGITSLSSGPLLFGKLGHRLIERLHETGAFDVPRKDLETSAGEMLDRMLPEEGATLLLAGMADERLQLRQQLVTAVLALSAVLADSKLAIDSVETQVDVPWRNGRLGGRLDLLLRDAQGRDAILDMKWGSTKYRKLLEQGLAFQLSVYAHARRLERGDANLAPAGYFALSTGKLFSTDPTGFSGSTPVAGPALEETWRSAERSVAVLERLLARGEVPVTGVRRALPLLAAAGVPEADRPKHFVKEPGAACEYCDYGGLCGKRWEEQS